MKLSWVIPPQIWIRPLGASSILFEQVKCNWRSGSGDNSRSQQQNWETIRNLRRLLERQGRCSRSSTQYEIRTRTFLLFFVIFPVSHSKQLFWHIFLVTEYHFPYRKMNLQTELSWFEQNTLDCVNIAFLSALRELPHCLLDSQRLTHSLAEELKWSPLNFPRIWNERFPQI